MVICLHLVIVGIFSFTRDNFPMQTNVNVTNYSMHIIMSLKIGLPSIICWEAVNDWLVVY